MDGYQIARGWGKWIDVGEGYQKKKKKNKTLSKIYLKYISNSLIHTNDMK